MVPPSERAEPGSYVEAAGVRTHVLREGSGAPIVLLHGSGPGVSAWSNWADVISPLAARFDVIAPDLAGFPYSQVPAGYRYQFSACVAQIVALLDALEIERPIIVGNSFGGTVALGAASLYPDRVAALVLLGVPGGDYPLTRGMLTGRLYEPGLANMAAALRMFPYDPSIVTPEMIETRYEMSIRPGAQQAVHSVMPEPPSVGSVINGFPEAALRKISAPAVILHGRDDPVVPLDCSLTLHRCLERSELHSFGRCGHWVQLERHATFVELVVKVTDPRLLPKHRRHARRPPHRPVTGEDLLAAGEQHPLPGRVGVFVRIRVLTRGVVGREGLISRLDQAIQRNLA